MLSTLPQLPLALSILLLEGSSFALARPSGYSFFRRSNTSVSVSVPLNAPESAPELSRSLVSLSIEGDRFAEWVGIDSKNQFFLNTLNNLIDITGVPPVIRVGANSEDKTWLNSTVNIVQSTFPNWTATTPYPEANINFVSPAYYALSKNLPFGTHMIWGVDFGANNVTNAVAEAQVIRKAFDIGGPAFYAGITLDAIEIGNEADLYQNNGERTSPWNITEYITQWTSFANAVITGANLNEQGAPSLILAAFANSVFGATGFSPQYLYKQGIISGPLGKYINTVSQHHYSGSFCSGNGGLLQALMAKQGVRGNITQFDGDIQATNAQGLTYIFGETNSYACHGAPGVSNTAGAAIWALDYVLQAASHNISRVHFHDGIGFKYNLIQPIALNRSTTTGQPLSTPLAPHVQPQYYAGIVAASLVGSNQQGKVATTISELSISDLSGNVGGYAAFDNGNLARAVLINSNAWLSGATGSRPNVTLSLNVAEVASTSAAHGPSLPTKVEVRRLTIGYADDTAGVTFGGKSYETSSGLPSGKDTYETVAVQQGSFEVVISSTEAILLTFID